MNANTEEAFLEAFREHSDGLFRHAYFRLSSRERALDLTQDTFIKAWDYVRGGGEVGKFKSFLYRVMHNLIIDEYRRSKMESLDGMSDERRALIDAELAEGSVWEAEEALDEHALVAKVKDAVAELPNDYRSAVTLRYIDGFTPKEISRMTGETENVISVRIHRAVAKLRTILATDSETQPSI